MTAQALGGVDDGTGATSIKRGSESADDCHCWVGEKAASEVDGRCLSVTVDISAAVVGGGGSSGTRNKTVATYWPFRRLQQSTGEVNARGALRLPRRRRIRCLPLNNSCRTERKKTREMRFFVASERAKSHTRWRGRAREMRWVCYHSGFRVFTEHSVAARGRCRRARRAPPPAHAQSSFIWAAVSKSGTLRVESRAHACSTSTWSAGVAPPPLSPLSHRGELSGWALTYAR